MNATPLPLPPVAPAPDALWASQLTVWDFGILYGLPLVAALALAFVLRVLWRPKGGPKFRLPSKPVPTYGATDSDGEWSNVYDGEANDLLYASAAQYDAPWTKTFDLAFLLGLVVFYFVLVAATAVLEPALWRDVRFWRWLALPFALTLALLVVGGLLCRRGCALDDRGYVAAERGGFRVAYVRKLVLLGAYVLPLITPEPHADASALHLLWRQFAALLAFVPTVQPLRERWVGFMLPFNALDRPEDRPHALKWTLAGLVLPSMLVLVAFRSLFQRTNQPDLVFVLVFIASIGGGLAEGVGAAWGQHKYSTATCLSQRRYTRSYEGSAVLFVAAMVFPALQFFDFASALQLAVAMLALPLAATYAEATAPPTLDAPVLMTTVGLVLFVVVHAV